ncbi:unannotated protein [freshwater metagenome]|uniref:Unannotated protein n=1 Tax=freshwater metagenome TaxID=449393 RepID=A0A6J7F1X0_9ZZZZ
MSAPIIVIVGRQSEKASGVRAEAYASGQRYYKAIERAGGIPLMLPPMPELLDGRLIDLIGRVDGVLFHGGGDIDPRRYGDAATAEQLYGIVHEHDEVELAVMRAAINHDLAVLGLCRGLQILNVALGGTLVQDIGSEDHWLKFHPVSLQPNSRLAKGFGTIRPARCHSVHHQIIDALGEGLQVVGTTDDGMLEAVELNSATWVVATQWHPEDTAHEDPEQQNIFDELVRQAAAGRARR